MPQDAFTIYHTAIELNETIKGARVDRIIQPEKDTVVFYLRANNKNVYLTACSKAEFSRVSLCETFYKTAEEAPSFCMLLRKHLSRSIIKSVYAIKGERIIAIEFICKDDLGDTSEKVLYCEIMGKYSNITLCENQVILGAAKTTSLDSEYSRKIFPGIKYSLPAAQDKVNIDDKDSSLLKLSEFNGGDLSEFIFSNFVGISRPTAIEIVFRYYLSNNITTDIKNLNIADFYKHFKDFYYHVDIEPRIIEKGKNSDFYVCDYKSVSGKITPLSTIYEAIEAYFNKKIEGRSFDLRKRKIVEKLNAFIKKQEKKLQIVNEKILSCSDADTNRLFGELIISNLYRIENGAKTVSVEDYSKEDYPLVVINLDPDLSPKENAERYFKKYSKQKKTLSAVIEQKKELDDLLKYLFEISRDIERTDRIEDFSDIEEELKKIGIIKEEKKKKERVKQTQYRTYQYLGYSIFVGKNNVQNDRLTFSADRSDVWLHVKNFHSSHVIIKTDGTYPPDKVILFAAEVCAYYSDAREADKVPVDYTLKKHVKKSGSQIGLVYYTDQKTIFVTPNAHL